MLNELFEGKQSKDFAFKFERKYTPLYLIVEFLFNLILEHFAVIEAISSSYKMLKRERDFSEALEFGN